MTTPCKRLPVDAPIEARKFAHHEKMEMKRMMRRGDMKALIPVPPIGWTRSQRRPQTWLSNRQERAIDLAAINHAIRGLFDPAFGGGNSPW